MFYESLDQRLNTNAVKRKYLVDTSKKVYILKKNKKPRDYVLFSRVLFSDKAWCSNLILVNAR